MLAGDISKVHSKLPDRLLSHSLLSIRYISTPVVWQEVSPFHPNLTLLQRFLHAITCTSEVREGRLCEDQLAAAVSEEHWRRMKVVAINQIPEQVRQTQSQSQGQGQGRVLQW